MSDPLTRCAVLQDLGSNDRKLLRDYMEERSVEAGSALFYAGEEASDLLIVAEGCVRVETDGQARGVVGPGEVLGGLSLVAIGTRACTAKAEDAVRVLALSREAYLRLRTEAPMIALVVQESILRSFAGSVRGVLPDVGRGTPSP